MKRNGRLTKGSVVKLYEYLDRVEDRETFFQFVHALIEDRVDEVEKEQEQPSNPYGPGANRWENGTIEAFLHAAVRWAEDSIGQKDGMTDEPTWKSFATFLWCGKIYE